MARGGAGRGLLMRRLLLLGAAVFIAGGILIARAADPDALWKIVHDRCVPDQENHASPAPCETVVLGEGYAILKDIRGATQFLLIPTARIAGIETPDILASDAPNYFRLAWAERARVSSRAGHALPDDGISLAINSEFGRTQNQLHIHIDCLRTDVRAALAAHAGEVGGQWGAFPVELAGRPYRAVHLSDLADNPFDILAHSLQNPAAEMPKHSLVLSAAVNGGFVLLDTVADTAAGNPGSGEELQDHACALAQAPS
jgi:CDP-diacylglycerol pyrophosphatase